MQKSITIWTLAIAVILTGGGFYLSEKYHIVEPKSTLTMGPTSSMVPTSASSSSALPAIKSASVFLNEEKATYISRIFGITFLYPKSLLISENEKGISITPLEQSDVRNASDVGILIAVQLKVRAETSIGQIEKLYASDKISSHQTVIAGKTAIYILNKDLFAGGVDTTYIFTINNHIFSATYYDTDYAPIYKSLLSSLSSAN